MSHDDTLLCELRSRGEGLLAMTWYQSGELPIKQAFLSFLIVIICSAR